MLERLTLISVWSVCKNPTRRSIIEARCRLYGGTGKRAAGYARGDFKIPQRAEVWSKLLVGGKEKM